jgi:phage-related baseplate assembly protein
MRSLIIGAAALALGACANTDGMDVLNKVASGAAKAEEVTLGNAAKAVNLYCKNVPKVGRDILRERWNARPEMEGAKVGIRCPGDPVLTLGE